MFFFHCCCLKQWLIVGANTATKNLERKGWAMFLGNKDFEQASTNSQESRRQRACPGMCSGILPDKEFLVDSFFISVFWLCHPTAFWPLWFLKRNQLLILLRIPYTNESVLSCCFKLSLDFSKLISEVILHGIHWASWTCIFISFLRFGKHGAIISSNFSAPFPFPLLRFQ